jgi:hypothetical protein
MGSIQGKKIDGCSFHDAKTVFAAMDDTCAKTSLMTAK